MSNKPKLRRYIGESITVTYDLKRCIHAAECVHGLPAVFDPEARPWVQPDQAPADQVAEVVQGCPTGALNIEWDGAEEATPQQNVIVPLSNGPLYVHGDIEITAGSDVMAEKRVALCRCGASKNKPFCDNSHQAINFAADGRINDNQAEADESDRGGLLTVTPAANGPCLLRGNFEIRSDDGESVFRGDRTALCRCGASANKPFCDGAHSQIGFSDVATD